MKTSMIAMVLALGFGVLFLFQMHVLFQRFEHPSPMQTANSMNGASSVKEVALLEKRVQTLILEAKEHIANGHDSSDQVVQALRQVEHLKQELLEKQNMLEELEAENREKEDRQKPAIQSSSSNKPRGRSDTPQNFELDKKAEVQASAVVSDKVGGLRDTVGQKDNKNPLVFPSRSAPPAVEIKADPATDASTMYAPSVARRSLGLDSPLMVLCYSRDDYLTKTLDTILRYHPSGVTGEPAVPIVVSQDGDIDKVNRAIETLRAKFLKAGIPFAWLKHPKATSAKNGYEKLAQHFGWAFKQIFSNNLMPGSQHDDIYQYPVQTRNVQVPPAARLIVLEEDIEIAPDFFGYFGAMAPLLDADDKLYSVSAWNDNGFANKVEGAHPDAVVRSDFFPGLGWMMNRQLWDEIGAGWPTGYWDDWMREPGARKGREVLRPEICRTFHFGSQGGTSAGQYNAFLKSIRLNKDPVDWAHEDLRYLEHDAFAKAYKEQLEIATKVTSLKDVEKAQHGVPAHHEERYYRLQYSTVTGGGQSFMSLAKRVGLMDDEKAMVPRGAFKGVVQFRHAGGIVLLAPDPHTIDWDSCGGRCK